MAILKFYTRVFNNTMQILLDFFNIVLSMFFSCTCKEVDNTLCVVLN